MFSTSISNLILIDHNTVNDLYQNYLLAEGKPNDQEEFTKQFEEELTKHANAEEMILYPAYEQYLGQAGKIIADESQAQYEQIKQLLHTLKSTAVSHPEHRQIFDKLMKNLTKHIENEENNDLPKFENAITSEISATLAQTFQQAKLSVPL